MKRIRNLFIMLKQKGLQYTLNKLLYLIKPARINKLYLFKKLFKDQSGLEIGGPSNIFSSKGYIPIYDFAKIIDGCNFSNNTLWEGNIDNGRKYNYTENKIGTQYISDATDLHKIPNSTYDFIISSNCLEHIANPLKAVNEWIRVVKKGGYLLLLLPNKEFCFDHNRSVVSFSHLLGDYENDIKESDLTHLNEILQFHDLEMDKPAGTFEQFKARSLKNYENRALHHHVFDIAVLKEIYNFFGLEILFTKEKSNHIILGKK